MNAGSEVVVLGVAETIVPWVHQLLRKKSKNTEKGSFEDSNETNDEKHYEVSPIKDNSVHGDTIEEKDIL